MLIRYQINIFFLALAAALNIGSVAASEKVAQTASQVSPLPAKPGGDITPGVSVTGFRSAVFGADEATVRAAISKDFGVTDKAIVQSQNGVDRTGVLTVKVAEVLGGGGAAEVAYVFGYKSKKLIQVSVIWSKATDKDMTGEQMLANGEILRGYFTSAGYDPKTVIVNSEVRDGILLFRGSDPESRTTALMLHGVKTKQENKAVDAFAPDSLLLFYLADTKNPDVFRIKPGSF